MESDPITTGFVAAGVAGALYVCLLLFRRSRQQNEARKAGASRKAAAPTIAEQALRVTIPLSDSEFGTDKERERIRALADKLSKTISSTSEIGEFDGDEFGGGICTLYMYGPSASKLFDVVIPVLLQFGLPSGSFIIKGYGGVGAQEERIPVSPRE
jgi:hypothetical protein